MWSRATFATACTWTHKAASTEEQMTHNTHFSKKEMERNGCYNVQEKVVSSVSSTISQAFGPRVAGSVLECVFERSHVDSPLDAAKTDTQPLSPLEYII
eukprot:55194-Eustigmatos_ZCMA.PRE.1